MGFYPEELEESLFLGVLLRMREMYLLKDRKIQCCDYTCMQQSLGHIIFRI